MEKEPDVALILDIGGESPFLANIKRWAPRIAKGAFCACFIFMSAVCKTYNLSV